MRERGEGFKASRIAGTLKSGPESGERGLLKATRAC
jgi:hypothetical protein